MSVPLPRTLHMRIMLAIALLQLVVVGLFSFYMLAQLVGNEVTNRQVLGNKLVALMGPAIEPMVARGDAEGLRRYLARMVMDPAIGGIVVTDASGATLFRQMRSASPPHPIAAWFRTASLGSSANTELRYDNVYQGLLTLHLSNDVLNENIGILLFNVSYLFLLLLALDLIATQLIVRFLVAPLGPLATMAKGVSQGNWDKDFMPPSGASDELRHLSTAFVESAKLMRSQIQELEQTRTQLAEKELKLRNLIDNMQEVLLELDKNGVILFLNPIWETISGFAVETSLHRPFASFLPQAKHQHYFAPRRLEQIPLYDLQLELRSQGGDSRWLQMNTTLQYNAAGEFTGIVGTLEDISENLRLQQLQREHEQNLYQLTITDPLTRVSNRRHFDEILPNLLQVNLHRKQSLALFIIDIDGFKFINDTYGHPVGDSVLRRVAEVLQRDLKPGGAVARLAGDEFAVLLPEVDQAHADEIGRTIHEHISRLIVPLAVGELKIASSIGVAIAPTHARTPQDLIRAADVALYHAKKSGRNRVITLSPDIGDATMEIFSQGFELRNALRNGLIYPFLQPIVDLKTGAVVAYEVLTRLKRGNRYITADEFVLVAEDLGLIRDMDLYVIGEVIRRVPRDIALFLNISLNSFQAPEFAAQLKAVFESPQATARQITIEFTERQTTDMSGDFQKFLAQLRAAGYKIALDDFGVGYSTLGYLRQLKPDFVKIDGSFVGQIFENPEDARIIEHIRELTETVGAVSIAEHIEDERTREALMRLGVQYGQGFHFGKPKNLAEYEWGLQTSLQS